MTDDVNTQITAQEALQKILAVAYTPPTQKLRDSEYCARYYAQVIDQMRRLAYEGLEEAT